MMGDSLANSNKEQGTMEEHIYCDDIGQIMVSGAIVRFDLMIQSATEKDAAGKPKLVLQGRVIMPIDAFLRATSRLQNSVQDMVKKGVIQRAPADPNKGAAAKPEGPGGKQKN
jgi:hypothetical protein